MDSNLKLKSSLFTIDRNKVLNYLRDRDSKVTTKNFEKGNKQGMFLNFLYLCIWMLKKCNYDEFKANNNYYFCFFAD